MRAWRWTGVALPMLDLGLAWAMAVWTLLLTAWNKTASDLEATQHPVCAVGLYFRESSHPLQ